MPVPKSFSAKTFFANVTFKLFLYNVLQSLVRLNVDVQVIFSAEKFFAKIALQLFLSVKRFLVRSESVAAGADPSANVAVKVVVHDVNVVNVTLKVAQVSVRFHVVALLTRITTVDF